jgi:hypothetical protein
MLAQLELKSTQHCLSAVLTYMLTHAATYCEVCMPFIQRYGRAMQPPWPGNCQRLGLRMLRCGAPAQRTFAARVACTSHANCHASTPVHAPAIRLVCCILHANPHSKHRLHVGSLLQGSTAQLGLK